MDDETIDKFIGQCMAVYDGSEKTPLYSKNDNDKNVLKLIVAFCMIFCIGILIVLLIQINYGSHQLVPHGNVASDDMQCSQYGIDVLKMGGNAVDAAITTALCNSVALPHLSGLGGNGVMIIYDHRIAEGKVIDFGATLSTHLNIGVPGFLAGLFYAHEKYGILPWKKLVEPSINLAKSGITVTNSLLEAINQNNLQSAQNNNLKHWLATVKTTPIDQKVKVPNGLVDTLTSISLPNGFNEFYKEMARELVPFLKLDDVIGYRPLNFPLLKQQFFNYTIITSNQGSGGPILLDVLKIINITNTSQHQLPLLNSFKDLGDSWYENSGLQVSTTDVFDSYVTIISGLGSIFGSRILTNSGYLLNNALELSPKNHIINQTLRSTSLHLPFIAIETGKICGRRLVSGSADVRDGAQILLSMLNTDPQNILSIQTNPPRFRFKNNDIAIEYPNSFPKYLKDLFKTLNYNISVAPLPYPTSNIIQKLEDRSFSFSDIRGSGKSFTI